MKTAQQLNAPRKADVQSTAQMTETVQNDSLVQLRDLASNSAPTQRMATLQRQADAFFPSGAKASQAAQRMSIGTVAKIGGNTYVSGDTRKKHVSAVGAQKASAEAGYGHRTFVTSEDKIKNAVLADDTDIAIGDKDRVDIYADVTISQWDKTEDAPAGHGKTKPVAQSINEKSHSCEIGVKGTGENKIKIMHFKKA